MTSTPEERLAAAGLKLPPTPSPVAVYVPAVRSGHYVYSSGQLPMVDGALPSPGRSAPRSPRSRRGNWRSSAR